MSASPDLRPHTLAIDIGGTGLKASVLDVNGKMMHDRVRVKTPASPCPPETLLAALEDLVRPLPPFDRIAVGFPGVIRMNRVLTAPHFGSDDTWRDFPLAGALAERFGCPVRVLNDAEVQGLGIIEGHGLEVVLTLGTGLGTAVFRSGMLCPHLELAHHPLHKRKTYNDYVGILAFQKHGLKAWRKRVALMLDVVTSLLHPEVVYIGGGNAVHLATPLRPGVRIASNDAGITGGIKLWDPRLADQFPK